MSDKTNAERLDRVVTIYACPVDGCPAFMGTELNGDDPDGDCGWNPDGWPRCTDHARPMLPVKVQAVTDSPIDHPAGCFYGSFMEAYPDNWHIPHGADCKLYHGDDPIHLEAPGAAATGGQSRG